MIVEYNGEKIDHKDLAEQAGIDPRTLYSRIFVYGWPVAEAVKRPVMSNGQKTKRGHPWKKDRIGTQQGFGSLAAPVGAADKGRQRGD